LPAHIRYSRPELEASEVTKDKILFVEDDPEQANVLRLYFEAQGYEVMQASWGRDGVEMARQNPPDLIVLDIRLPDVDGYEVCRQIRRNWRTSQTPVIFLTELKQRGERLAGLKLGAIDYLTKPYDVQELRLRVRNALSRAKFESLVDPVTGLPGEKLIDSRLQELIRDKNWAIVLVSVLGLEDFKERYGFVSGNEVLRATSLVLTKAIFDLGGHDNFVGDPGRGDFIMVVAPEIIPQLQERVITELKRNFARFYPVSDREGQTPDAAPSSESLPAISVAIGTVTDHDVSFGEVSEVISTLIKRRTVVATVPQ
jgi:CheY-like chemotaxis protein